MISVLMAVHRGSSAASLDSALESVTREQTLPPAEIVVVLDGDISEAARDVLTAHQKAGICDLKLVSLFSNSGLGVALQVGLTHCSHDLIARMDDDDRSLADRFSLQSKFLSSNPDVDVVGGAIRLKKLNSVARVLNYPLSHDGCFNAFKTADPLAHPAVMFRRRFFMKAGTYSTLKKNQDTELWLRGFAAGCKFSNLETPILDFNYSEELIRRRKAPRQLISLLFMRIRIARLLKFGLGNILLHVIRTFVFFIAPSRLLNYIYLKRKL